jgi:hypothetical protein
VLIINSLKTKKIMKKQTLKALVALTAVAVLATSCGNEKTGGSNAKKGTTENPIDANPAEPNDCCPEISFCGISKASLLGYIVNYRDSSWRKTSPYFYTHAYQSDILTQAQNNDALANSITTADFDSRFVDLDIKQLESYICAIKNNEKTNQANTVRVYFIRYGNNAFNPDYNYKNSIALIPAQKGDNNATIKEFVDEQFLNKDGGVWLPNNDPCINSTIANNNVICPPLVGCTPGTLLSLTDQ